MKLKRHDGCISHDFKIKKGKVAKDQEMAHQLQKRGGKKYIDNKVLKTRRKKKKKNRKPSKQLFLNRRPLSYPNIS